MNNTVVAARLGLQPKEFGGGQLGVKGTCCSTCLWYSLQPRISTDLAIHVAEMTYVRVRSQIEDLIRLEVILDGGFPDDRPD